MRKVSKRKLYESTYSGTLAKRLQFRSAETLHAPWATTHTTPILSNLHGMQLSALCGNRQEGREGRCAPLIMMYSIVVILTSFTISEIYYLLFAAIRVRAVMGYPCGAEMILLFPASCSNHDHSLSVHHSFAGRYPQCRTGHTLKIFGVTFCSSALALDKPSTTLYRTKGIDFKALSP